MEVMPNFLGEFFWFWGVTLHNVLGPAAMYLQHSVARRNSFLFNALPVIPEPNRKETYDISERQLWVLMIKK